MTVRDVDILLVEDNPSDIELTVHALRKNKVVAGIEIVRDGEEALDFLFRRGAFSDRSYDPLPKLILLDLKLPKINGTEVLRQVKGDERTETIPVVILTGSKEERDLLACYQLGVNSYIQKPVNFDEFKETARQLGVYWLLVNQPPPLRTRALR